MLNTERVSRRSRETRERKEGLTVLEISVVFSFQC